MMIRAGYSVIEARRTWIKMNKWQSVTRPVVKFVMNLKWFRRTGLITRDDYTNRNLEFEFARWSRSGLPGRYEPFFPEWAGLLAPLPTGIYWLAKGFYPTYASEFRLSRPVI